MKRIVFIGFFSLIIFSFIPLNTSWEKMQDLKNVELLSSIKSGMPFDFQLRKNLRRKEFNNPRLEIQSFNPFYAKTLGREENSSYAIISATRDGGFLLAGYTKLGGLDGRDSWISKLSPTGNIEWQRVYEIKAHLFRVYLKVSSIVQTDDNGFIVAGTCSYLGGNDYVVFKLLSTGDISWARIYDGPLGEAAHSIRQTSDGGFIVSGVTTSFINPPDIDPYWDIEVDILVLKLSPSGDIEWQRSIGGPDFESDWLWGKRVSSIIESSDGGYLLLTDTFSFSEEWTDIWAVKLTQTGDIEWQRVYGGKESEWLLCPGPHVRQTTDGKYIIASYTLSFGAQYSDVWVLKLLQNGDIDWQKRYGGNSGDVVNAIELTKDDGCIIAGGTRSFGAGMVDFWVLKLSPQGDIEWQRTYGGDLYDEATSICILNGGGFGIVGISYSFDDKNDILVLRLSPDGELDTSCREIAGNSNALVWDTHVSPEETYVTSSAAAAGVSIYTGVISRGIDLNPSLVCWNLNQPPLDPFFERVENKSYFVVEPWHTVTWLPNPYNAANHFDIVEYVIYRKSVTEDSNYAKIGRVPGNTNIFVDKELEGVKQYLYAITSVDSEGNESPKSEPVGNVN